MAELTDVELVGVTETTVTVAFAAAPSAPATVTVGDRAVEVPPAEVALRLVRVTDLEPATSYRVAIRCGDHETRLAEPATTLSAPTAEPVATLATLNDLHFGEQQFGGIPGAYEEALVAEPDQPYWQVMNAAAVTDINAAGVDRVVIKGDIADTGTAEQFAVARQTFDGLTAPWDAFLGNHDLLGEVDGYAILGQPPAPRVCELAGWRLIYVDSVLPGHHHGCFPADRRHWLAATLAAAPDLPTLIFMHHQPVPAAFMRGPVSAIGMRPADSEPLIELIGQHRQVRAVLIGHTHRNRVRHYPAAPAVPFVEVGCTKDYPGVWAHYRLFGDGSLRQEVRRISAPQALAHSLRCGRMWNGDYRRFALGKLSDRCFVSG